LNVVSSGRCCNRWPRCDGLSRHDFDVKPYANIGDPPSNIGDRIRDLTDGPATVEGVVTALDPENRLVRITGFVSQFVPSGDALQAVGAR
jgi:hypothetical protein